MKFVLDAVFAFSTVGYLEYPSMPGQKNCSFLFSLRMAPPNSIWNSSYGSSQLARYDQLLWGIPGFKFLPKSLHALHSLFFASRLQGIYGHHMLRASDSIANFPYPLNACPQDAFPSLLFGMLSVRRGRVKRVQHSCLSKISEFMG